MYDADLVVDGCHVKGSLDFRDNDSAVAIIFRMFLRSTLVLCTAVGVATQRTIMPLLTLRVPKV